VQPGLESPGGKSFPFAPLAHFVVHSSPSAAESSGFSTEHSHPLFIPVCQESIIPRMKVLSNTSLARIRIEMRFIAEIYSVRNQSVQIHRYLLEASLIVLKVI